MTAHGERARTAHIAVSITVLDLDESPGAPAAPTMTAAFSTRLTMTWAAPENTGPAITDYDVQYRAFGAEFEDVDHDGTGTTKQITGLRRSTNYEVRYGGRTPRARAPGPGRAADAPPPPVPNTPPVFTRASSFAVPENTVEVATLATNDPDSTDRIVDYAIAGVADGAGFEIVEDSVLAFVRGADYEAQVRAHNAEGPGRWSLPGRGTTSVNQAPAFLEPTPRRSLREDAGPGEEFGAPVRANDANGDPLTCRLGGLDAALFVIEPDTGQLTTGMGVGYDHEARDSHELTVTAADHHSDRTTVDVTITVTDVIEPPRGLTLRVQRLLSHLRGAAVH